MKKHPLFIGFVQAVAVAIYVALVTLLLFALEYASVAPPVYFAMLTMLLLFVVSAAVVGSLIFAYPAVLAMHKKTKRALQVLASTLGWIFVGIVIALLIIFI